MRTKLLLLLVLFSFVTTSELLAKKKEEVDHVALAALLMRDGNYDRAAASLREVDLNDEKTDFVRYYTLSGLISMKLQKFEKALVDFNKSLEAGQEDKAIYIYIAQSHFQLKAFQKTIDALNEAGDLAKEAASLFGLKAQCFWELKSYQKAIHTVDEGLEKFAKDTNLYKQAFFYLNELHLYQEALVYGHKFLEIDNKNPHAYTLVASALKKSKEIDLAIEILEEGKIHFPSNTDITILLAHLYIEKGMINIAADLFDQAAIVDSKYIKEASELYKRAKKLYRALYFNAQTKDQKEKLKQRMAILLEFGDYEMAAAMEKALKRVGLVKDEDIRYALAFSLFQASDYKGAEKHLSKLTRTDLFRKAVEIRKSIQKCEETPWECN